MAIDQEKLRKFTFRAPMYVQYIAPNGFLPYDVGAHALFHYFNVAMANYKRQKEDLVLEHTGSRGHGETRIFNYHQLWLSIAQLYNTDPNTMGNYWPAVDMQAKVLGLTKCPQHLRSPKNRLDS